MGSPSAQRSEWSRTAHLGSGWSWPMVSSQQMLELAPTHTHRGPAATTARGSAPRDRQAAELDWSHGAPAPTAPPPSRSPWPWRAPSNALLLHPGRRAAPGLACPSLPQRPWKALKQNWRPWRCPHSQELGSSGQVTRHSSGSLAMRDSVPLSVEERSPPSSMPRPHPSYAPEPHVSPALHAMPALTALLSVSRMRWR